MLHKLPIKEVPNELIIPSDSISLIDAVGEGNPVAKLFVITYRPVTLLTKICVTNWYNETVNEEVYYRQNLALQSNLDYSN